MKHKLAKLVAGWLARHFPAVAEMAACLAPHLFKNHWKIECLSPSDADRPRVLAINARLRELWETHGLQSVGLAAREAAEEVRRLLTERASLLRPAWVDEFDNIVVNAGLNDILDKYWKGSGYSAAFFVGITGSSPTFAAGDTMASHAGWTELTDYTEGTRRSLTLGTVASQSVDNSASKASFTINASVNAGGAFITTSSTKGGTTGTLVAGAAFSGGNRALVNGDTLLVTTTLTAASA